jgi:hypothetical protein
MRNFFFAAVATVFGLTAAVHAGDKGQAAPAKAEPNTVLVPKTVLKKETVLVPKTVLKKETVLVPVKVVECETCAIVRREHRLGSRLRRTASNCCCE